MDDKKKEVFINMYIHLLNTYICCYEDEQHGVPNMIKSDDFPINRILEDLNQILKKGDFGDLLYAADTARWSKKSTRKTWEKTKAHPNCWEKFRKQLQDYNLAIEEAYRRIY